jgi:hypothetical protein
MATVAEIISQVLRRLDELSTTVPVHWTREEILVFVNDALTELNLASWIFQGSKALALTTIDNVYDQPAGIIAATGVRCPNYLRRETLYNLDLEAKWDSAGENRNNVETWCPLGLNKLLIYPRPLVAKTAYVEGIIEHTPVTDNSDPLPVRAELESAIEDYCVERATFKEGPSEISQVGNLYKNFLDKVQAESGRNVIRMFPRFSVGVVADDGLREQSATGEKQDGD